VAKILYFDQHDENGNATKEFLRARCGRITASRLGDVMAYSVQKGKEGKELKTRADYKWELMSERMTGLSARRFVTPEMLWGTQQESEARTAYEIAHDVLTEQVGFAIHPTMDWSGASPDSLVGTNHGVDFKCFTTERHLEIYRSKNLPQEIYDQMQWCMVCCEVDTWDVCFWDPRLFGQFEHLKRFEIPVYRNNDRIAELEAEVLKMHTEIEAMIDEISKTAQAGKPQEVAQ
jgi:hypothetical protein